mgnify:CR=1 FL=1
MKNLLIIFALILFSSCVQNNSKKNTELIVIDCLKNSTFCSPNCETPKAMWSFSSDKTFKFKSKDSNINVKGFWADLGGGVVEASFIQKSNQGEKKEVRKLKFTDCESFMEKNIKYVK